MSKPIKKPIKIVFAYLDLRPASRKGELWKDITGYEGYYQVSNHGRVRSVTRMMTIEFPSKNKILTYRKEGRIRRQKLISRERTITSQTTYECLVSLYMDGTSKTHLVSRLVYNAFSKAINFERDRLMVSHKDGDGRHNHYSNLRAETKSKIQRRSYEEERHRSPFATMSRRKRLEMAAKAAITRHKPVQRISATGRAIKNYPSILAAAADTGTSVPNVVNVLKGRKANTKGYIFRYNQQAEKSI